MELDITLATALRSIHPLRSHLSLHLSDGFLDFLITDVQTKKHLKKSRLSLADTGLAPILKGLSSSESPYRSVSLTVMPFERTLIPSGLFKESEASRYMDQLFDLPRNVQYYSDALSSLESHLLFALGKDSIETIIRYFPTCRVHHGMSVLMEGLTREGRFDDAPQTLIHLSDKKMEMIILRAKKPVFFNVFRVENETDVAYHLLHTLELHSIDHESAKVMMAGTHGAKSEEYGLLASYCPQLELGKFEGTLDGMKQLSDDETSRDIILLNQYQCA